MSIELKQLGHYIDSGLMFYDDINQESFNALEFITSQTQEHKFGFNGNLDQLCRDKHLHVIVFPLSALTEPVLEGGKIPIVELLMLSYGHESKDINLTDVKLYYNDGFYVLSLNELEFGFDETDFSFIAILNGAVTVVGNQLALYDQLYEWHFWLFRQDLFETGELIDKRTTL